MFISVHHRIAGAAAVLLVLSGPASADTIATPLTATSGWSARLASNGASVLVEAAGGPVILGLTTTGSPPAAGAGVGLVPGERVCWSLAADLYAQTPQAQATVKVTPGVNCPSGGSSGGMILGGQATLINRSGSITLGGGAQSLMAANASRHGCWIQNLSTGDEWINENGGTAAANQPNIWVPPGAYWPCPETGVPTTALSIFGAVTGQTFSAREW